MLAIAPNSLHFWCWIDICISDTFFVLSILSSFLVIKLSRRLANHAGSALDFQIQRADKNKLQQQGFNGWLKSDSWFRLEGDCQELLGPQRALYSLLHGIIGAGEGAIHMRVNEPAAGGTWMWAGARPAPAVGASCLCWLVSTTPASASSPSLWARAPAPCYINAPFAAPL